MSGARVACLCVALCALARPLDAQRRAATRAQAESLFAEGRYHALLLTPEHRREALAFWRESAAVFLELGDTASHAEMLINVGHLFRALTQPDSALAHYARAAMLYERHSQPDRQAWALRYGGVVLRDRQAFDSARAWQRRSLAAARSAHDTSQEAQALFDLADVYERLEHRAEGRVLHSTVLWLGRRPADSAALLFHEAADLWARPETRDDQASALTRLGVVHADRGRLDSALTALRDAEAILRARARESDSTLDQLSDRVARARALPAILGRIGDVLVDAGRLDEASEHYAEALRLFRAAGDSAHIGVTLRRLGEVTSRAGYPRAALSFYQQAAAGMSADSSMPLTLVGMARTYSALGQGDTALAVGQRALALASARRDGYAIAEAYAAIGATYAELGREDSALNAYNQAIRIDTLLGNARPYVHHLIARADVNGIMGMFDLFDAANTAGHVGDRRGLAITRVRLAAQDRSDSAAKRLRPLLDSARAIGDRSTEGLVLSALGAAHLARGAADSARAAYAAGVVLAREIRDRIAEVRALTGRARAEAAGPNPDVTAAAASFDSAAALNSAVRVDAGSEGNRMSFAELQQELFGRWTLFHLDRASNLAAARASLAVTERGRSQALLDLMRATTTTSPGGELAAEGERLLRGATANGAAVLEYLTAADTLIAWLALPNGGVHMSRTPVSTDSLALWVRALRDELGAEAVSTRALDGHQYEAGSRGFGAARHGGTALWLPRIAAVLLPDSLARWLPDSGELIIVPQGPLGLVPFAALPVGATAQPLAQRLALRFAPSLRTVVALEQTAAPARGSAALVVGNPRMPTVPADSGPPLRLAPLPGANAEGQWVARRLGVSLLTGDAATETAVKRRLADAGIVHLATHGLAYGTDARARSSFVALAPDSINDGLLTAGEILDDPALQLHADLVVLSACETGLGNLKQAEGTIGLQRALLARGARSVLVSLWSVSDEATSLFMQRFYGHWLSDPDHPRKAEALRRAQADVRAKPRFADPFFWAAFQLVGTS